MCCWSESSGAEYGRDARNESRRARKHLTQMRNGHLLCRQPLVDAVNNSKCKRQPSHIHRSNNWQAHRPKPQPCVGGAQGPNCVSKHSTACIRPATHPPISTVKHSNVAPSRRVPIPQSNTTFFVAEGISARVQRKAAHLHTKRVRCDERHQRRAKIFTQSTNHRTPPNPSKTLLAPAALSLPPL